MLRFLLWLLAGSVAFAHEAGQDYFFLAIQEDGAVTGRFELESADLGRVIGRELSRATPREVLAAGRDEATTVQRYLTSRFTIMADGGPLTPEFTEITKLEEGGVFAQYHFVASVAELPKTLSFKHELLYEHDPAHRGILVLSYNPWEGRDYGEHNVALIFDSSNREQELPLTRKIENLIEPPSFRKVGMRHILDGPVHLFLVVAVLLGLMARRDSGGRKPRRGYWQLAALVLALVTLCVVLQAGSLALSATEVVKFSIRRVEAGMAFLLLAVSLHNLRPRLPGVPAAGLLLSGLLHGLSSRGALGYIPYDLDNLKPDSLWRILLSYSTGNWISLAAVALVALTIVFFLRRKPSRELPLLFGGSLVTLMAGAYLLALRFF